MQTFIAANAIGTKIDLAGINESTIKMAKRFFSASTDDIRLVADLARPGNAFWFHVGDQDRALELINGERIGPVVSARTIKDSKKAKKAAAQASNEAYMQKKLQGARRIRHGRYGEGSVIGTGAGMVGVMFDGRTRPIRVPETEVETI